MSDPDPTPDPVYDPASTLIPTLWTWGKEQEVHCAYYDSFDDVWNAAHACERLGFGWRVDAYIGQISDTVDEREWRLVAWKELRSDAIIRPRAEELEKAHDNV